MSHNTTYGRIFTETRDGVDYGVSIADIQSILGLSNSDIGGLITAGRTNGSINLLSYHKPTQYSGLDSPDPQQPRGVNSSDSGYYSGFTSYGVQKAIITVYDSQYHPGDRQASLNGDLGIVTGNPVTPMQTPWSLVAPTKYRFLDFDGYVHSMSYADTGTDRPYLVSPTWVGQDGFSVVMRTLVRYAYQDSVASDDPRFKVLGLRSLIGLDGFATDTPAYMGVLAFAPLGSQQDNGRLDRTIPVMALAIKTGTQLGATDSAENYNTGDSRMIAIERTIPGSLTSTAIADQSSKFLRGEQIWVAPVLCRRNDSDTGWNIFPFTLGGAAQIKKMVINPNGGSIVSYTTRITSAAITYRIVKRASDGAFVFYLQRASSLQFATSGNAPRIYFAGAGNGMSAGPGDGNTSVVKYGSYTLGTAYDNEYERYYSVRAASMDAGSVLNGWNESTAYENRAGTFILLPYSGASSFKINVQIQYLQDQEKIVYMRGTATVNTSASTGDTVTVNLTNV